MVDPCFGRVMNWNSKKIDAKIAQLEQQKQDIDALIDAYWTQKYANIKTKCRDTLVECCSPWFNHNRTNHGCGKFYKISDLTYIQTHHYVKPFSCCGGDYWIEGEGQFVCPTCGYLNRLLGKDGETCIINKREYLTSFKRYFKKVIDTYDD